MNVNTMPAYSCIQFTIAAATCSGLPFETVIQYFAFPEIVFVHYRHRHYMVMANLPSFTGFLCLMLQNILLRSLILPVLTANVMFTVFHFQISPE